MSTLGSSSTVGLSVGGFKVVIVTAVFMGLAYVAVLLRLCSRYIKRRALDGSDWLVILALIPATGEAVTIIYTAVALGLGYHITQLDEVQATGLLKAYLAGEPLWITTNTLVKLSILEFYRNIFESTKFRLWALWAKILTGLFWLTTVVRGFFLCQPFAFFWNKTIPHGFCVNLQAAWIAAGVINTFLDVWVIVLPLPMLWGLKIRTSKKWAISALFCIGLLICIITILRLYSLATLDQSDVSYNVVENAVWSMLEPALSIVNACLPSCQPVASKFGRLPVFLGWKNESRSFTTYGPADSNWKEQPRRRRTSQLFFRRLPDAAASDIPIVTLTGHQYHISHGDEVHLPIEGIRSGVRDIRCMAVPFF